MFQAANSRIDEIDDMAASLRRQSAEGLPFDALAIADRRALRSASQSSYRSITPLPSPRLEPNTTPGKKTFDFFSDASSSYPVPPPPLSPVSPISSTFSANHRPFTPPNIVDSPVDLDDSPTRLPFSRKLAAVARSSPHHPVPVPQIAYPDPFPDLNKAERHKPSRYPTIIDRSVHHKRSLSPLKQSAGTTTPKLASPEKQRRGDPLAQLSNGSTPNLGLDYSYIKTLGTGAFSTVVLAHRHNTTDDLVAIKMINKAKCQADERMRISVLREIEVLKHINHPSLVHLTESFSTSTHDNLVLEYCEGGELYDFLERHHQEMSEPLCRRIFGELVDVVEWMHAIHLVHRDIKLENVLLCSKPYDALHRRGSDPLTSLPTPFIKLTDFGLSRFIDPSSPYLETRCGSEEYAAPELIMGRRYDGRQTDAWALGVVLYAILTGTLPFTPFVNTREGSPGSDGSARSNDEPSAKTRNRRTYLLRIAKAEYTWPTTPSRTRLATSPARTIVDHLLNRDADKRTQVKDLWRFEWMNGVGSTRWSEPIRNSPKKAWVRKFSEDEVAQKVLRMEVPPL